MLDAASKATVCTPPLSLRMVRSKVTKIRLAKRALEDQCRPDASVSRLHFACVSQLAQRRTAWQCWTPRARTRSAPHIHTLTLTPLSSLALSHTRTSLFFCLSHTHTPRSFSRSLSHTHTPRSFSLSLSHTHTSDAASKDTVCTPHRELRPIHSKLTCLHAINFRGANLVTSPPNLGVPKAS